MTTVKVFRAGRRFKINIEGHSGYAPSGQDIVCAGISALSQAAAQMYAKMDADGDLQEFNLEMENGKLSLFAVACKWSKAKAKGIYEYFCEGTQLISQHYPENIVFIVGGEK